MDPAQLATVLTAAAALVVAVGHVVADLTGLIDAFKARRAAGTPTAAGAGKTPPAAAG